MKASAKSVSNTISLLRKVRQGICLSKKSCVHQRRWNCLRLPTHRSKNWTEAFTVAKRKFRVWRGDSQGGEFKEYEQDVGTGMVVLDVLHAIQAEQAGDLALRWNCKAGKCGSCSMEINGKPKLSCMTRMNTFAE